MESNTDFENKELQLDPSWQEIIDFDIARSKARLNAAIERLESATLEDYLKKYKR